jgi:hypothetical protein
MDQMFYVTILTAPRFIYDCSPPVLSLPYTYSTPRSKIDTTSLLLSLTLTFLIIPTFNLVFRSSPTAVAVPLLLFLRLRRYPLYPFYPAGVD